MPEFTTSRAHFADFPHRLWPEESCAFTAKFCHYHLHRRSSRSRAIELPGGIGGSMREPGGIHEMYSITCLREYPAPSFEKTSPSGRTIEKDGAERGSRANDPAGPSFGVSWFCAFMISVFRRSLAAPTGGSRESILGPRLSRAPFSRCSLCIPFRMSCTLRSPTPATHRKRWMGWLRRTDANQLVQRNASS